MKQEKARDKPRGKVQLQIADLPFSAIPHQSKLFLEYQSDPHSLKRFYPNAVASPAEIASFVPEVLENYRNDRESLCDALTDINVKVQAANSTLKNIELLRDPECVAVLTGQQAGLFTGPLYTIYKALSAIKLAEFLRENGIKAVPIFWAATEDHDFDEVSRAFLIDKNGEMIDSGYGSDPMFSGMPVGDYKLDGSIDHNIEDLFDRLSGTEFTISIKESLQAAWRQGVGFGDAFLKTLATLFADLGLVFIDPMHPGIKSLSSKIYLQSIQKADLMIAAVRKQTNLLETEGYHSQVLVEEDYFPLFWINDEGKRTALRNGRNGTYRVKGERRSFTQNQLLAVARNNPERLSPGVLLRPAVQDYLLPTVCYFGGASEIAYFAQNSEVYRTLERPITPILHRQSFTLIDPKQRKVLDKFQLKISQLFVGAEQISLDLAEKGASLNTAALFADVEETIITKLNSIDQHISQIDITVAANFAKRRRKMIYHIAATKKKALLALIKKDEVTGRQIEQLFSSLLPNGELQERSINVFTYLNKYGPELIAWLYESIDLNDKDHRLLDL